MPSHPQPPTPPPANRGRRLGFAVLALVPLVAVLWFARRGTNRPPEPPPPPATAEVALADLVRRDDRLHLGTNAEPFSGLAVERYPDGSPKSRSEIRDGVLEGPSEGWFTNGVLQVRETFRAGVAHGPRTRWHPDGKKASEATVENGRIVGTFRRWREDGTLAEEIAMENGEPHGVSRSYYPSGAIQTEARLDHGRVVEQKSWKDGENLPAAPERTHPQ
ncbi:MAG: toxin-antitoxin system YwqK family antitoxin [Verrucomicrobiales bacterium]|nr:toxin-antitoxin system YwqK family antitoxin [Verrucomicrobiales bacterium]